MNKEKKIWQLEQCLQRADIMSISLMKEAARAGGDCGRGIAIVAEECRNLFHKLYDYIETISFDEQENVTYNGIDAIVDIAVQIKLLAVNAVLELRRNKNADGGHYRPISVCVEEIRNLAAKIISLSAKKYTRKSFTIPEITSPLKSTEAEDYFFQYSIGGVMFVENTHYIKEIHYPDKSDISREIYNFRGWQAKIVDLYKKFDLNYTSEINERRQALMIISTVEGKGWDNLFAVPIDDSDENYSIFISKIGYNVPPKVGHLFAKYVRECWDAVGDDQLIFLDWEKFV